MEKREGETHRCFLLPSLPPSLPVIAPDVEPALEKRQGHCPPPPPPLLRDCGEGGREEGGREGRP